MEVWGSTESLPQFSSLSCASSSSATVSSSFFSFPSLLSPRPSSPQFLGFRSVSIRRTWKAYESPGRGAWPLSFGVPGPVLLGRGLRTCISNKFPGALLFSGVHTLKSSTVLLAYVFCVILTGSAPSTSASPFPLSLSLSLLSSLAGLPVSLSAALGSLISLFVA